MTAIKQYTGTEEDLLQKESRYTAAGCAMQALQTRQNTGITQRTHRHMQTDTDTYHQSAAGL